MGTSFRLFHEAIPDAFASFDADCDHARCTYCGGCLFWNGLRFTH
jgi:hypothetical protein